MLIILTVVEKNFVFEFNSLVRDVMFCLEWTEEDVSLIRIHSKNGYHETVKLSN